MRFQLFAARAALAALVLAVLAAAVALAGVRLGAMAYATGLLVMVPATGLAVLALVLALLWARAAFASNTGTGKRMGLLALAGSLAFLYPPLSTLWYRFTTPPIHDAATDPDDPPQFVALAKLRGPGMNPVAFNGQDKVRYQGEDVTITYALHEYKDRLITRPRRMLMPNSSDPVKTLFWRCFEDAKALGWSIADTSEKDGRIEATTQSFWFGRISDIVIRVRPSGFMGARYDARAESRADARDNGFNIRLLKAFRDKVGT